MDKVSIVIPAYNEEKRIGKTLEAYSNYFERLRKKRKLDYEILIVINNTTDKTEYIVKAWKKKNKNIRYINLLRGGKGYAVIEGFKDAFKRDNDLIGFVDADMATSPEYFYKLIENIESFEKPPKLSKKEFERRRNMGYSKSSIGNYDGAIASRYIKGSVIEPKPTIQRLIAKRIFNFFVKSVLFLPYKDTQCGAKIFKRYALERVLQDISMSQWAFDVDLLYSLKKIGFRIKEIPTKWSDKEYSKINFWKAGPWMALGVIRLRIINSPLKKFVRIYDKFLGFVPK